MKITLVKKILLSGEACKKCQEVLDRLEAENLMSQINEILIADERDDQSAGMLLAKLHQVERAPFFVVEEDGQPVKIYTVYFQFVKDVLKKKTKAVDEDLEVLQQNQDLDFL